MGIQEEEVMHFVSSLSLQPQSQSTLWAITMPSTSKYFLGPVAASMAVQYHILHFTNNELVVIAVDAMGKLIQNGYSIIPNTQIKSIKFDKKLICYQLNMQVNTSILSYRVNKVMVGCSWHKTNLERLIPQKTHQ